MSSYEAVQILSNPPWAGSGFATECALLVRQLRARGVKVLVQADTMPFGAVLTWEGTPVAPSYFPNALKTDMVGYYAERHHSDLVLVLLDAYGMNAEPDHFKDLKCPAAWWVPVDSMPLGATTGSLLKATEMTPIAMSRFGEVVLRRAGLEKVLYVPHSADTDLFSPAGDIARKTAREAWGASPETFVIGINSANQHPYRKGWFGQLYAFKMFLEGAPDLGVQPHPDSLLLAWTLTDGRPQGLALDAVAEMLGITDHVRFRHPGDVSAGVASPADVMRQFYAACDLGSNCSWGEAFGIAGLEFQSCGIPLVTTDYSAMSEVAAGGPYGAWKVASAPEICPDEVAALYGRPHLPAIVMAYQQAWEEREAGTLDLRGEAARDHALGYDHRWVFENYWLQVLDQLMG